MNDDASKTELLSSITPFVEASDHDSTVHEDIETSIVVWLGDENVRYESEKARDEKQTQSSIAAPIRRTRSAKSETT